MNIVQHVLVRAYNPRENEVHTSFTFLIHPSVLGGDWEEVRFIHIVTYKGELLDFLNLDYQQYDVKIDDQYDTNNDLVKTLE